MYFSQTKTPFKILMCGVEKINLITPYQPGSMDRNRKLHRYFERENKDEPILQIEAFLILVCCCPKLQMSVLGESVITIWMDAIFALLFFRSPYSQKQQSDELFIQGKPHNLSLQTCTCFKVKSISFVSLNHSDPAVVYINDWSLDNVFYLFLVSIDWALGFWEHYSNILFSLKCVTRSLHAWCKAKCCCCCL